ncbi:MAG: hypothetical protein ABJF11_14180 [Reichenbachiella sp.]|uniref:hypothetical protein n=1 Tax=Reichenbachiella sp. TaxID=2184521 RepID=UPI003263A491
MADTIMKVRLKLDEDVFFHQNEGEANKQKTYAKVVDIDGKAYFKTQFEINTAPQGSSTETMEYADFLHDLKDKTLFLPNTYEEGGSEFKLKYNEEFKVSTLFIKLQVGAKAPGGSGH